MSFSKEDERSDIGIRPRILWYLEHRSRFPPPPATFSASLFSQMAGQTVLYGDPFDTTIVPLNLCDEVDSPDRTDPFSGG
jgi:hypothetical protein